MGEISAVMNEFLRDKIRFADLFNGFCFGGENVIKAGDLQESSEQYAVEIGGSMKPKLSEKQRDIMMRLKSGSMLRILAIENQNLVDYTMPFRCMQISICYTLNSARCLWR